MPAAKELGLEDETPLKRTSESKPCCSKNKAAPGRRAEVVTEKPAKPAEDSDESSSESSSAPESDSENGDAPPTLNDEADDSFKWFAIGKRVHIVSPVDNGIDLPVCREEIGLPFRTRPRLRGAGWSDTIEELGLCSACADIWAGSALAQTSAQLEPPVEKPLLPDKQGSASMATHSSSDESE